MYSASRESSPIRAPISNGNYSEITNHILINGNHHSDENLYTNGHSTTEHSDDEYIDTVEVSYPLVLFFLFLFFIL